MDRELLNQRKKAIYEFMCSDLYVPMKQKELAALMNVPRSEREELAQVLDGLVEEGRIECSKKGKYSKAERKARNGVFTGNIRGFGFVTVEGEPEDIFIPEAYVNGAMHGDFVQVELLPGKAESGKRREGKVAKVLERGTVRVVGLFQKKKTFGFVCPDYM